MDMVYNRQSELGLSIPESAIVIGCGGLGFWVASALCLAGVNNLTLIDGDNIETHNRNRLLIPENKVGENKALVLADILKGVREQASIIPISQMCSIDTLEAIWNGELVVDCTDSFQIQKELYQWATNKRARYIRAGVTADHITVTSSVPDWEIKSNEQRCGVTIPAWIAPMLLCTAYVMEKITRTPNLEICKSIKDG